MSRTSRQATILSIISSKEIETQDELVDELKREGYVITQATISRDIKELGLIKTLNSVGRYRYVTKQSITALSSKLLSLVRESVISVVSADNLLIVRTIDDAASVVSGAIEQLGLKEILGILADKCTILVVCSSSRDAMFVLDKVNQLIQ